MKKILIFGNSGSGKSTLAKRLSCKYNLAHLDLDTLAWLLSNPPKRKPIEDSSKEINQFIELNKNWVIEGCYTDLLITLIPHCSEIIYMDLSVDKCISNAKARPWEPHKYTSMDEQNQNLNMLIQWISDYPNRSDTFSKDAHIDLFDKFKGKKSKIETNSTD